MGRPRARRCEKSQRVKQCWTEREYSPFRFFPPCYSGRYYARAHDDSANPPYSGRRAEAVDEFRHFRLAAGEPGQADSRHLKGGKRRTLGILRFFTLCTPWAQARLSTGIGGGLRENPVDSFVEGRGSHSFLRLSAFVLHTVRKEQDRQGGKRSGSLFQRRATGPARRFARPAVPLWGGAWHGSAGLALLWLDSAPALW